MLTWHGDWRTREALWACEPGALACPECATYRDEARGYLEPGRYSVDGNRLTCLDCGAMFAEPRKRIVERLMAFIREKRGRVV